MTIINKHIVKTYMRFIGTCLGGFVSIYLIIDFLEKIGKFSKAGAGISDIFIYYLCRLPEMIGQTTPMAVLMGTLLTMGTLSRSNEITAMRSSGISLLQISKPILITAACISVFLLLMQEVVTPHANEKSLYIEQVVINKKSASAFFRQNNIWHRDKNNILQAHFFSPETQELKGITLWQVDPSMRPLLRIDAESGKPIKDGWILSKVVSRKFQQNGQIEKNILDNMAISLSLDMTDLRVIEKSAEDMGVI
ncbi:MAG: LptF/LptG family permease, partial [Desulfuromonadales bacterium]|nr:LptF/LptG family permease [Desulfuromonadales bacterium]